MANDVRKRDALTSDSDYEIAPGFKVAQWKDLNIQDSTAWSPSWKEAVDVFEKRMNARFINQIEVLIKNPEKDTAGFSGFAVVALDCLLIETLDQFYNGRKATPRKRHVAAFHAVFQRSRKLGFIFDDEKKSEVFYDQIRCGLLHQAQTKKKSKISRNIKGVIAWCDAANPSAGLIVQPRRFHKCVKEVYSDYLKLLQSPQSDAWRDKFRTKMNIIAGLE